MIIKEKNNQKKWITKFICDVCQAETFEKKGIKNYIKKFQVCKRCDKIFKTNSSTKYQQHNVKVLLKAFGEEEVVETENKKQIRIVVKEKQGDYLAMILESIKARRK